MSCIVLYPTCETDFLEPDYSAEIIECGVLEWLFPYPAMGILYNCILGASPYIHCLLRDRIIRPVRTRSSPPHKKGPIRSQRPYVAASIASARSFSALRSPSPRPILTGSTVTPPCLSAGATLAPPPGSPLLAARLKASRCFSPGPTLLSPSNSWNHISLRISR